MYDSQMRIHWWPDMLGAGLASKINDASKASSKSKNALYRGIAFRMYLHVPNMTFMMKLYDEAHRHAPSNSICVSLGL